MVVNEDVHRLLRQQAEHSFKPFGPVKMKGVEEPMWLYVVGGSVGVRPSMGSVGDAYHNALCESFFATLECELPDRQRFRTQAEAKMAVFDFIEGFYNPRRRHSALGQLSPVNFERSDQHEAAA